MRQPKLNWAKALSSRAASRVATKKYSLYMGLVWSDQAPSRLNQNSFCITKAFCISSCGIIRRTFSQVSRSLPLGVWTRYQRTRPCWLLVVAPLNAPGSFSWRRAVCSMFSPPLLDLRCTQMQGRLEQASRSQLGAVAKVQVFVSFDVAHYTSNFKPFSLIAQITARADTSPYPSTKTCTFLHNKKSRSSSGFFSFGHEKRRLSFMDGRLC